MNLSFHAPHLLWLATLALPLIALWFLRLRRPRLTVPSLALWLSVVEDRRANSLFQRLRRQIQLLLQLLALLALALAAAQPVWSRIARATDREAVVIDVSASMAARLGAGGASRLDEAKKLGRARVAGIGGKREACLVVLGRRARMAVPFTTDARRLDKAIAALEPECAPCDPGEALRLLRSLHRAEPFAAAVLISDAVLPAEADEDLACTLELQRVAPGGANLGVTAFQARRGADGAWEVQVEVTAGVEAGSGGVVRIATESAELLSRSVAPAPLSAVRVLLRLPAGAAVALHARVEAAGADALASDDEAWLALPESAPVRTWVAPRLTRWRRALAAQPAVQLVELPTDAADLIVADAALDLARPSRIRLGVGVIPPDLAAAIGSQSDERGSRVVDVRATHPLLAHLRLDDLAIAERVAWVAGSGERDLERAGWTVLAHGDAGPLLIERQRPDGVDWDMLFHSDRSDLPYRLAFPVLCGNLVQAALHAAGRAEVVAQPTGILPPLRLGPGTWTLEGPAGGVRGEADSEGIASGVAAPQPGLYRLRGSAAAVAVGTGLLDARETRLQPVAGLHAREVTVGEAATAPGDLALWPWLAALALACLLGEWWLVNKDPRRGGPA